MLAHGHFLPVQADLSDRVRPQSGRSEWKPETFQRLLSRLVPDTESGIVRMGRRRCKADVHSRSWMCVLIPRCEPPRRYLRAIDRGVRHGAYALSLLGEAFRISDGL